MNKGGGRWVLNLDRRQRLHDLNDLWLETVDCLSVIFPLDCCANRSDL